MRNFSGSDARSWLITARSPLVPNDDSISVTQLDRNAETVADCPSKAFWIVGTKNTIELLSPDCWIANNKLASVVAIKLRGRVRDRLIDKVDLATAPSKGAINRRERGRYVDNCGIVGNKCALSSSEPNLVAVGTIGPGLNHALGDENVCPFFESPDGECSPDGLHSDFSSFDDEWPLWVLGNLEPSLTLFEANFSLFSRERYLNSARGVDRCGRSVGEWYASNFSDFGLVSLRRCEQEDAAGDRSRYHCSAASQHRSAADSKR